MPDYLQVKHDMHPRDHSCDRHARPRTGIAVGLHTRLGQVLWGARPASDSATAFGQDHVPLAAPSVAPRDPLRERQQRPGAGQPDTYARPEMAQPVPLPDVVRGGLSMPSNITT